MKPTHYSKVDMATWPLRHFTPQELACKGDGMVMVDARAAHALQSMRDFLRGPIIVNSAYRSPEYNKKVGGAPGSKHMLGQAFDIRITPFLSREKIHELAKRAGFTGFGDYDTFVHVDVGPARYWDLRKKKGE